MTTAIATGQEQAIVGDSFNEKKGLGRDGSDRKELGRWVIHLVKLFRDPKHEFSPEKWWFVFGKSPLVSGKPRLVK